MLCAVCVEQPAKVMKDGTCYCVECYKNKNKEPWGGSVLTMD